MDLKVIKYRTFPDFVTRHKDNFRDSALINSETVYCVMSYFQHVIAIVSEIAFLFFIIKKIDPEYYFYKSSPKDLLTDFRKR